MKGNRPPFCPNSPRVVVNSVGLLLLVAAGCTAEITSEPLFAPPAAPDDDGSQGGGGQGGSAADAGGGVSDGGGKDAGGVDTGVADAKPPPIDAAKPDLPPAANPDLQYCVDEINRYRATQGKGPYGRSATLEAFAAEGARVDGLAHVPHSHFQMTKGGGVASAENEIPWWSLRKSGSVREIIRKGLAVMWAEGPGEGDAHGHYRNMSGNFKNVGCGIFVNGDEVTVVQDFR